MMSMAVVSMKLHGINDTRNVGEAPNATPTSAGLLTECEGRECIMAAREAFLAAIKRAWVKKTTLAMLPMMEILE
jgi:hypothetical protein